MPPLPLTVGAALPFHALNDYKQWLLAEQRDLEIQDFYDNNLLDSDWRPAIRHAKEQLSGHTGRVGIHGPTEGLPLICRDRRVQALVRDRLLQGLEVAAELGASHMVVHSPFEFFGHPQVAHAPHRGLDRLIELATKVLEPVLGQARGTGCTLVVEVCYDASTVPLLALIRAIGGEGLRLSVDVGHAFLMQRAGGPPPDQWIRDGGALLEHLHLQDTDSHADRHWAPGEGNLNWYAIFEALAELAHTPRLLLELNDPAKVRQGAAYLEARGLVR
jgi:sugar phosphate isomerase/epimerase